MRKEWHCLKGGQAENKSFPGGVVVNVINNIFGVVVNGVFVLK
jgi:hypothetical protein